MSSALAIKLGGMATFRAIWTRGKHKVYIVTLIAVLVSVASFAAIHSDDSSGATAYASNEGELINAVYNAGSGDTVVVTHDIDLTKMIYVSNKKITLEGQLIPGEERYPVLKRSAGFNHAADARGDYNPGLFEVATGGDTDTVSLTLKNITIDDNNNPDGFSIQIPVDGGYPMADWEDRVYDGVISSYTSGATVTLDDGARIINVGGASAIRMAGGTLNLKQGSYVEGSNASYKSEGAKYYGAIWVQGDGTVLNFDAEMDGNTIIAPYFYTDMYEVAINFNGKINNCNISQPLFKTNLNDGFVLKMSTDSEICDNNFSPGIDCIDIIGGTQNEIELCGKISGNKGGNIAINIHDSAKMNLTLYGEISDNVLSNQTLCIFGSADSTVKLMQDSKISGNTVSVGAIYLNYAAGIQFHIYGEISHNNSVNNNGGAMYAIYNDPVIYVHSGAKIIGNTAYGSGGAIYLNYTAKLIMDGGTISGNTALCKDDGNTGIPGGGGVAVARSAMFTMNGGTITGNTAGTDGYLGIGGGVFVSGKNTNVTTGGKFIMNGGTVTGNDLYGGKTDGVDIAIGGSNNNIQSSPDKGQYIQISEDATIGAGSIGAATYNATYSGAAVYLLDRNYTLNVGTVLAPNQTVIAGRATVQNEYNGYSPVPNTGIWYQITKTTGKSDLIITYPPGIDPDDYEWIAAIQPMGKDGAILGEQCFSVDVPTRTANGLKVTVPLMADAEGTAVGGYGIVLLNMLKSTTMTLDVTSSGGGEFYIDSPGGPEYQATLDVDGVIDNFVISPSPGWEIKSVILTAGDGSVFDRTNDALNGNLAVNYDELASGTNVIHAVFEQTSLEYSIIASADDGSEITPSGTVSVAHGDNKTFTFSAKDGYHILAVYADGVEISPVELASGEYTFTNVIADHTIEVVSDVNGGGGNGGGGSGTGGGYSGGGGNGGDGGDGGNGGNGEGGNGENSNVEGGNGEWAVLNLVCAILAVFTGIIAVIAGRDRFRKDNEEKRSKTALILRVLALIIGIISVIIFFITEDWSLPVAPMDNWTLLMFILLLATLILTAVSFRFDGTEDSTDG